MSGDGGEDINIEPLLNDLHSEQFEYKMAYAKRLCMISLAIGPERTRSELLTIITNYFDVEDEILCVIAEEIGAMVPFLGGQEYYKYALAPLEKLCVVEEVLVAEKAVASIIPMILTSTDSSLEALYFQILGRLNASEWFTGKISSCALLPPLLKSFPRRKQELMDMYASHSSDQTPMVRQAAAKNLPAFIPALDHQAVISFGIPVFKRLSEDDLDFVRFSSVQACVALFQIFEAESNAPDKGNAPSGKEGKGQEKNLGSLVVPLFKQLALDKSWRTRQKMAENLKNIALSATTPALKIEVTNVVCKYLKDDELEVRITTSNNLPSIAAPILTSPPPPTPLPAASPNASTANLPVMVNPAEAHFYKEIAPLFKQIVVDDSSTRIREAIAQALPQLAPSFGKAHTPQLLVPHIKDILMKQEEATEVKLALLNHITPLFASLESASILDLLRTCFEPLAYSRQWRVRQCLLQMMPTITKNVTVEIFNQELLKICLGLLGDQVAAVRDTACLNVKELSLIFKDQWIKTLILPNVAKLTAEKNYLLRITALTCLTYLCPLLTPEDIEQFLVPVAFLAIKDPVPNVRFNVAKTLYSFLPHLNTDEKKLKLKPYFETLSNDKDKDVKAFALHGISAIDW